MPEGTYTFFSDESYLHKKLQRPKRSYVKICRSFPLNQAVKEALFHRHKTGGYTHKGVKRMQI
jgi:hypothetical protein